MLKFLSHNLVRTMFLLSVITVEHVHSSNCTSRRCLSNVLIDKNLLSQPQNDSCTHEVRVPKLEYQTLEVNTKQLRLLILLQASIEWEDPELAWDTSVYKFDEVILPVDKIWTPELLVTNAMTSTLKHGSANVLVYSNGTVKDDLIIYAEVNCEVNLFNYPFAYDVCPVAVQAWDTDKCGTTLVFGEVRLSDNSHGDWQTVDAKLQKKRDDRNYIQVELKLKPTNPFLTLMLPSYLILFVDIVSFALPLRGGGRNAFKVTLVLSFTLFINILNSQLPGDSECSPIIRPHFCICLIFLIVSMLVSMLTTRLSLEGQLVFCCWSKGSAPKITENKEQNEDEETKANISTIQPNGSENSRILRKVAKYLETHETNEAEKERQHKFADMLDKTFFWIYFIGGLGYLVMMTVIMLNYKCEVNHFDFWYN
ncbi:zinc-activated ligand-gated ion channel [Haplochromis burtoni]|uniref:zinc-activated ligand-gated ion channel n=1 Tax=Haplochromis burtoni TaxID=8153 RepID=UPI0003BD9773|nr:zinc-activated ligand-gated ion channel [Haplochromis burtoni]